MRDIKLTETELDLVLEALSTMGNEKDKFSYVYKEIVKQLQKQEKQDN